MNKIFRIIFFAFSLTTPFFLYSCLDTDVSSDRTEAIEQKELSQAVTNLISKGYDVDTTTLGSYYLTNKTGSGDYPQSGDTCCIIYTGFFLDGTIFDASYYYYTDSIWELVYMEQSLITGFNEAISLLNEGAEADFIIPSKLAYGESGYYEIPAYTPLGFNIKMRDIRKVQ